MLSSDLCYCFNDESDCDDSVITVACYEVDDNCWITVAQSCGVSTSETPDWGADMECPFYCADNWIGDKYCDRECSWCDHFWVDGDFDGNDCGSDFSHDGDPCPSTCYQELVGNGECNEECLSCREFYDSHYVFDDGDCALDRSEGNQTKWLWP